MIDYCARNHTGELRNILLDATAGYRGWELYPAYIGIGFFVRGERPRRGRSGSSTRRAASAGSTGFWIDPEREISLAFLSTGLMEDSHHFERLGRLSDLIVSSIVR